MIFYIIIPAILIIILSICLKSPTIRGKLGERKVKRIIGKTIENKQYIINNLILKNDQKTSQIDHVVINQRGVFVIETKNYSGKVYGAEKQQEWTQVLAYGHIKNKLYNPLKQNATHVYNIKRIIGNFPIHSIVVFVQNNTNNIEADNVIPLSLLKNKLKYGETILSLEQMKTAYETLLLNKETISTKEHINNIKKQQRNLENGICPRCGGNLVLRNGGKYGNFWGCSHYPKCKFTKKV